MAGIADIRRRDVAGGLARSDSAVVAAGAGAVYLGMVDAGG